MSVLTALATFLPVLGSLPAPLIILDGDGRIEVDPGIRTAC